MAQDTPTTFVAFLARGREIGFVVLHQGILIRYGIKTIKGRKQGGPAFIRRVEQVLTPVLTMAGHHGVIVVERDADRAQIGALCRAVHRLPERWGQRDLRVCAVSWEEVKMELCRYRQATQGEVTQVVVERQPLLWPLFMPLKAQRMKYWKKVFLAAAMAEVANRQMERKRRWRLGPYK